MQHLNDRFAQRERPRPRLFQQVEASLLTQLATGKYRIGARMPSERELCDEFKISRPTLREALAALQVQGFIEVRVGSGAFVRRIPNTNPPSVASATALELIEARRILEAEVAALAATRITPVELETLEGLSRTVMGAKLHPEAAMRADREFHITLARGARNSALERMVSDLVVEGAVAAEGQQVYDRATTSGARALDKFYGEIIDALRRRNVGAARGAVNAYFEVLLAYLARSQRSVALS